MWPRQYVYKLTYTPKGCTWGQHNRKFIKHRCLSLEGTRVDKTKIYKCMFLCNIYNTTLSRVQIYSWRCTCTYLQTCHEIKPQNGDLWPPARSFHAACCLSLGTSDPKLLVSGGCSDNGTLEDTWIFYFVTRKWIEVRYVTNNVPVQKAKIHIYVIQLKAQPW